MGRNRGKQNGKAPAKAPAAGAVLGAEDTAGKASGGEPAVSDAQGENDLPRYRSHKIVGALKLSDIELNNDNGVVRLTPEDKRFAPFNALPSWYARFTGGDADTGYFVRYDDGFASWSPTEAFEGGYTPIEDREREEITFRTPLGIEELARGVGAAARLFANTSSGGEVDIFTKDEAAIMVDFVRANPDAPVLAMFNHLTLTKRLPRTSPNRDDEFVLTLFHAAVKAAHQLEADRAAEQAAKQPAPQGTWPGEQALKPAEPAFSPTGFSPR
jgi:hypothetical protein